MFEMHRAPQQTLSCGKECLQSTWEKAYQKHRKKVGNVGARPLWLRVRSPEQNSQNARALPGNEKLIFFSEMKWLKSHFLKRLVI